MPHPVRPAGAVRVARAVRGVPVLLSVMVAVLAALAACGDGTVRPDAHADHVAVLAQGRRDARDVMLDLLAAADRELVVATADTSGRWRGCESAWPDGYLSYQYLTEAAVHVVREPSVGDLRAVLAEAGASGVRDEEIVGAARVAGRSGGLPVSMTAGGGHVVALRVGGPCVVVPHRERNAWLLRPDRVEEYGSR